MKVVLTVLKNERGVMLTELLVGMLIMALIGAGVMEIMSISSRAYTDTKTKISNVEYCREITRGIANELRYAGSITVNNSSDISYTNIESATPVYEILLENNSVVFKKDGGVVRTFAEGKVSSLQFDVTKVADKAQVTVKVGLQKAASPYLATITTLNTVYK
jgi:Tfp pilus assembly protein PilW